MLRRVSALVVITAALAGSAIPLAFAKLPPFTATAEPDGLRVLLTVTFDDGGEWSDELSVELGHVLVVVPQSVVGSDGTIASDEPRMIHPLFEVIRPGVQQSVVELPHPGTWTAIAFPGIRPPPSADLYVTPTFEVIDPIAPAAAPSVRALPATPVRIAAIVAAFLAVVAVVSLAGDGARRHGAGQPAAKSLR